MSKRSKPFRLPVFFKSRRDSHAGHILYLFMHFPFFWYWKVGIGYDFWKRAKQIDRAVIGFPIPIMVLFVPGAYYVEQDLHRHFAFFNTRFYVGDGASEWFWIFVAPIVFALMVSGWLGYIWLFDLCFGTGFFYLTLHFIVDCILRFF